jgi:hypothetical protein
MAFPRSRLGSTMRGHGAGSTWNTTAESKRTNHEFLAEISAAEGSSNSECGLFRGSDGKRRDGERTPSRHTSGRIVGRRVGSDVAT